MPPFIVPFPLSTPISFQSSDVNSENFFSFLFWATDIQNVTPPSTAALIPAALIPSFKVGLDSSYALFLCFSSSRCTFFSSLSTVLAAVPCWTSPYSTADGLISFPNSSPFSSKNSSILFARL